jgi:predicted Zn-dependent protease
MKKYLLMMLLAFASPFVNHVSAQEIFNTLVPLSQDVELGKQVSKQIESDKKVKILDETKYPEAYAYIRAMTENILNSGKIQNRNNFPWIVKIIHDDKTLNAFCTPGGFIYVYTGLIKFLDNDNQLAGVLGHEIAHADKRHSTKQMLENQGIQLLTQAVMGKNQNAIANLAKNLIALKFSRNDETEADKMSVEYLCNTMYQADGAAGFFIKLQEQNKGTKTPAFLSTHPNSANRVAAITADAAKRECQSQNVRRDMHAYTRFKAMLPK